MKKIVKEPSPFLPMSREEMEILGWDRLDVLLVTGDAYVDHPAFGASVIGRALEAEGFRVGIIAQPNWERPEDFEVMGAPALFVGVTAGAMDSMVANYTANRKPRRNDAFTPSGREGKRPNYATIVYTNVVRSVFKNTPVVIGGIEASLRRFAHFDYWKNKIRRSILLDSKADILVAGMGEKTVVEIAKRLKGGKHLHRIPGTVEALPVKGFSEEILADANTLPSCEEVAESKLAFLKSASQLETALCSQRSAECQMQKDETCAAKQGSNGVIVQNHGDRYVVEWPAEEMTSEQLDAVYALPFRRESHPSYGERKIPALEPVQFSVVSHRGCFGGCTFCALALHQGRHIISRTKKSVLAEIERLTEHPSFHGTITDVGGPTANMYGMKGMDEKQCSRCKRPSCLYPEVCENLETSHQAYLDLLESALKIKGVKHLFIASGIRHDLLPAEEKVPTKDTKSRYKKASERRSGVKTPLQKRRAANEAFFDLLVRQLVGGHLSLAPEHVATGVLRRMRKPPIESFIEFSKRFEERSAEAKKEQYITPYFIASFPGSTEADMKTLMRYLKLGGRKLQQVQDFLPSPMTLAAAMFHAELDAATLKPIAVAKIASQRQRQRELMLYHQQDDKKPVAKHPSRGARRPGGSPARSGPSARSGPGQKPARGAVKRKSAWATATRKTSSLKPRSRKGPSSPSSKPRSGPTGSGGLGAPPSHKASPYKPNARKGPPSSSRPRSGPGGGGPGGAAGRKSGPVKPAARKAPPSSKPRGKPAGPWARAVAGKKRRGKD